MKQKISKVTAKIRQISEKIIAKKRETDEKKRGCKVK